MRSLLRTTAPRSVVLVRLLVGGVFLGDVFRSKRPLQPTCDHRLFRSVRFRSIVFTDSPRLKIPWAQSP